MKKINKIEHFPSNWLKISIEEVIFFQKGKKPKRLEKNKFNNSLPYLDIKAFEKNEIRQFADEKSSSIVYKNDIVIVWDGARSGWVAMGKSGALGSTLARFKTFLIESKYLYYFLKSKFSYINNNTKGVGIPHIDPVILWNIKFPLPPLNEQKRIVEKIDELFSELDNAITSLKKAQQQLKIYRQALLKNYGDEYNFYKPTDLNQGINTRISTDKLSLKGYSIARKAPKNSILVTCIGATIGKTGLIRKEGAFNQQINAIIPSKEFNPKFVYFQIISNEFQKSIKKNSSSTTLPILNKTKFSSLLFKKTSFEHQNKIVSILEERFSIADNLEKTIEKALKQSEILRQSILKKAFEGKLVPQDPNDEPASKLLERIKTEKEKYLQEQKGKKKKTVKRKQMKKMLSIEEILENAKEPIPAKDVWQQSKYKDDIEAFYAELKKIQHKIKEIKKGTESLLELKK